MLFFFFKKIVFWLYVYGQNEWTTVQEKGSPFSFPVMLREKHFQTSTGRPDVGSSLTDYLPYTVPEILLHFDVHLSSVLFLSGLARKHKNIVSCNTSTGLLGLFLIINSMKIIPYIRKKQCPYTGLYVHYVLRTVVASFHRTNDKWSPGTNESTFNSAKPQNRSPLDIGARYKSTNLPCTHNSHSHSPTTHTSGRTTIAEHRNLLTCSNEANSHRWNDYKYVEHLDKCYATSKSLKV